VRPDRDETWLRVAVELARRSTCLRRGVGCVLLDDLGQVLATGYNGRARGLPHCNEPTGFNFVYARGIDKSKPLTGQSTGEVDVHDHACPGALRSDDKRWPSGHHLDTCEAIHAEQNALLQCHDVRAIRTCYVTASPCLACVKLLMNTGCRRIVFAARYAHDEAAQALWLKHAYSQKFGSRSWHLFEGDLR